MSEIPSVPARFHDEAWEYCMDILSGEILSGPHIRAACRRHLDDLLTANQRGLVYDTELAQRAVAFFETVLTLSGGENEGAPFTLFPWQKFLVMSVYGWVRRKTGYRRFRKAYIETGKGSGKSPLIAGFGIRAICGDNEKRAQGYVLARTSDQAKVTFEPAVAMVQNSDALEERLTVLGGEHPYRIVDHESHSFLARVASDKRGQGKSGPIPHIVIVDEYHEHETSSMRDMYAAGVKNRRQPLVLMITNSGVSLQSPCGQEHIYAKAVSHREIDDDEYFAMVFGIEESDKPMVDELCWIKANPSLCPDPAQEGEPGVVSIPGYDYIRGQVREATGMPSKRSKVERLNFCRWVDAEDPWIDRDKWEACEVSELSPEDDRKGKPAWLAFDLSQKTDLTAGTICWDMGTHFETDVKIWTPLDTLEVRAERDSVPYGQWVEQGYVDATPGAVVDMRFPVRWIISLLDSGHVIQGLAYDPWRIDLLIAALDEAGIESDRQPGKGIHIVPHPQGFVAGAKPLVDPIAEELLGLRLWMPRSLDDAEKAILAEEVRIKINPCLRMAIAGMIVVSDAAGNRRPTKTKSILKIDPAVSFVMALGASEGSKRGDFGAISSINQLVL